MKNRNKQRYNRRIKEEMLDRKDMCGLNDPTPYEAVKEIIKEFKKRNDKKGRMKDISGNSTSINGPLNSVPDRLNQKEYHFLRNNGFLLKDRIYK